MTSPMDQIMRAQLAAAQTAFARRRQGLPPGPVGPPTPAPSPSPLAPTLPGQAAARAGQALGAAPAWTLSPPGHPAPAHEFNVEPIGDGSWRMYPPGVQAPPWGPQGTSPTLPTHDDMRAMGAEMRRAYGGGVPGTGTAETPEQAQARLGALPGRRVGQYRRAGLTPPPPGYHPPGWGGDDGDGGDDDGDGGDDGTGGTGGNNDNSQRPGPYVPGVPTMDDPHRGQG